MLKSKQTLSAEEISALQKGDTVIFQKLFHNYQPRIYRFLWLKVRSVELAEDLVQEVFLRLWQARERLDAHRNLEIYIFRIAANLVIDTLRVQKPTTAIDIAEKSDIADPRNADDKLLHDVLAAEIDRIVSNMPERPQTAFILSRHQQLSHKQIAEIMDISVKTVEKHITSALKVLRIALRKTESVH